jgi:hydrogenase maturation factor HypF (carbamoyltransferase family)
MESTMSNINHYHRCNHCSTEWGHSLSDPKDARYSAAHDCPSCGKNQRWVSRYENDTERERFNEQMYDRRVDAILKAISMKIDMKDM